MRRSCSRSSELRRGFEPVAAALAASNATARSAAPWRGAVSDMAVHGHSGDLEAYLVADVTFHRTLLEARQRDVRRARRRGRRGAGRSHPPRPDAGSTEPRGDRLHDTVARAIRTGDGREAERAMRELIEEAASAMAQELDED